MLVIKCDYGINEVIAGVCGGNRKGINANM
jgi:hypothetical protein